MFIRINRIQELFSNTVKNGIVLILVAIVGIYAYSNWWVPTRETPNERAIDNVMKSFQRQRDKIIPLLKGLNAPFLESCVGFEQAIRSKYLADAKIHREEIRQQLKDDLAKQSVDSVRTKLREEAKELLSQSKYAMSVVENGNTSP